MRKPMSFHGHSPNPCLILVGGFLQLSKSHRFSLLDLMISWCLYLSSQVPVSVVEHSTLENADWAFPLKGLYRV